MRWPTRAKKTLNSGTVVIPYPNRCPLCRRWRCLLWLSCPQTLCPLRSLLGAEASTYLPHYCCWGTRSISCPRRTSRMRCPPCCRSLGGLFFHPHLSGVFFFGVSFVFYCSFVFLAAGFFSFIVDLLVLSTTPQQSLFHELITAAMATIFSCSLVGLPHVFSSSRSRASYLFSVQSMRSSAM